MKLGWIFEWRPYAVLETATAVSKPAMANGNGTDVRTWKRFATWSSAKRDEK